MIIIPGQDEKEIHSFVSPFPGELQEKLEVKRKSQLGGPAQVNVQASSFAASFPKLFILRHREVVEHLRWHLG